jgi:hypothetical protein
LPIVCGDDLIFTFNNSKFLQNAGAVYNRIDKGLQAAENLYLAKPASA